jgi:hypothetical protein
MNFPILALFNRSLRHDARQHLTYVLRLALTLVILWALFIAHAQAGSVGAPGLGFFKSVVNINLVFITLAGFSYFASAITEEKEEMTLGLLRMTALSPVAILLGKSTSRMLTAVMMLAVQLPFTMLSVTLGGMSLRQLFASYATLAAYTLFLSNLALLFSVTSRKTAWAATKLGMVLGGCLLVYGTGPLSTANLVSIGFSPGWAARFSAGWQTLYNSLPMERLKQILSTGYAGPVVGPDVVVMLGAGLACFLAAWAAFNLATREQHDESPGRAFVPRDNHWWRGLGAGRAWRRPLIWKDYNFIVGGRLMLWARVAGLAAVVVFITAVYSTENWLLSQAGLAITLTIMVLAYLEMLIQASRIFRSETQWQTLSSLMTLPMAPGVIVREKIYGCLLGMTPYLGMLLLGLTTVAAGLPEFVARELNGRLTSEPLVAGGFLLLAVALFTAQCIFFLYLVVYLSLAMKRGALAAALAIWAVSTFLLTCAIVVTPFLIPVIHYQVKARLMRLATEEA